MALMREAGLMINCILGLLTSMQVLPSQSPTVTPEAGMWTALDKPGRPNTYNDGGRMAE
jgi:hypothetical protein